MQDRLTTAVMLPSLVGDHDADGVANGRVGTAAEVVAFVGNDGGSSLEGLERNRVFLDHLNGKGSGRREVPNLLALGLGVTEHLGNLGRIRLGASFAELETRRDNLGAALLVSHG